MVGSYVKALHGPPRKERNCVKCGGGFIPPDDRRQTTMCEEHRPVLKGKTFEELRGDRARKSWLLRERGHQCEVCKGVEWMGQPIPLEIDHIDGDPGHNTRDNLRLICPNCHAQTPTHCGRNNRKLLTPSERALALAKYPRYRDLKMARSSTG